MLHTFEATGTIWHIKIWDKLDNVLKKQLFKNIKIHIKYQELIFSRFDPNSDISKFSHGDKNISVEFYEAFLLAKEVQKLTDAVFNPNTGELLKSQGYGAKDGSNLDFGAFVKGKIVDDIKDILLDNGVKYFLINGGGDIYVSSNFGNSVPVTVDLMNKKLEISVKNIAVCTSNNSMRNWKNNGKEYSHIPNTSAKSVCITHPSCMVADLIATISMISKDKYWDVLEKRFGKFDGVII